MDRFFQLTDLDTGRVVGEYQTEEEAISALRELASQHGTDFIAQFSLVQFSGDTQALCAMEHELIDFVFPKTTFTFVGGLAQTLSSFSMGTIAASVHTTGPIRRSEDRFTYVRPEKPKDLVRGTNAVPTAGHA